MGIEVLVGMLNNGPDDAKGHAARAIGNLADGDENKILPMQATGVMDGLVIMLSLGPDEVKSDAAFAVAALVNWPVVGLENDVIEVLARILKNGPGDAKGHAAR